MARNPLFDDLRRTLERLDDQFGREPGESGGLGSVSVDVTETDDAYEVTADLPGFETDDIDVSVHDDALEIAAEHTEESEDEREDDEATYIRRERRERAVTRRVPLPGPVVEADATASYTNGVLTVTLPKAGASSGHTIDIE